MRKYTWAGCILAAVAAPLLAAEDSVELTIRGRLNSQTGVTTITAGEGVTAQTFTLVLPDDRAMKEAARNLDGKKVVVIASWERKEATIAQKVVVKPSTRVVLINGVEKVVPVSGKAMFEVQKKVVEFVRVKSLSPAAQGPASRKGDLQEK
jgi:hypothetical protein